MKQKLYLFLICMLSCVSAWAQDDMPLWSIENQNLISVSDKDNKVVNRENVFHLPEDAEEVKATFQFNLRMNRPASTGESADRPQTMWYGRNGAAAISFVPSYTEVAGEDSLWAVSFTVDLPLSQISKDADVLFAFGLSANSLAYQVGNALHIWSLPETPDVSPATYTTFTNMAYTFTINEHGVSSGIVAKYTFNGVALSNRAYSGTTLSDIGDNASQEEVFSLQYSYTFGDKVWKEGTIENAATLTTVHRPIYSCSIQVNGQAIENTAATVTHSDEVVLLVERQDFGYGDVFTPNWSGQSSFVARNTSDAQNQVASQVTMTNRIGIGLEDRQSFDFNITVLPEIRIGMTIPAESYTFIPDGDTKVSINKIHNQEDLIWNVVWSLDGTTLDGVGDSPERNEIVIDSEKLKNPGVYTLRALATCYKEANSSKKYIDNGMIEYAINVLENPEVTSFGDFDNQDNTITCDGQEFDVNIETTGGYETDYHFNLASTDGGRYGISERIRPAEYRIRYNNPTGAEVTSELLFEGYNEIPENVSTTGEKQTRSVKGNNRTFNVTIFPHPTLQFAGKQKDYFYGSNLTQSVDTLYRMTSNWTFAWSLDGQQISDENIKDKYGYQDVVAEGAAENSVAHIIQVNAVNRYKDRVWADTIMTFAYTAWHRGMLNGIDLSHENTQNPNIYEGHDFAMDALSQFGYPDGWEYTWAREGSDAVLSESKSDIFKAEYTGSENSQIQVYKLIAKNNIPGLDEEPFTVEMTKAITVWRKAENYDANADASVISITDNGNNAVVNSRISEGRILTLRVPQALYGYNNSWNYVWNVSDENSHEIQIEIPGVQASGESMAKESRTFSLEITNMGPNGIAWENNNVTKTYTVYKKPRTPESLIKKGNGNTRTLVATMAINDQQMMTNEYYLCFGCREEDGSVSLIAEPQRQQGAGQTRYLAEVPQIQWGRDADLCTFALWHYDDDVWITSDLRFLNGTVDNQWDGSDYDGEGTYNGATRSDYTTSIQESVVHGQDIQSAYGLGGTVRGTMQRGINILRMKDGSVKKIIKK